MKILAVSSRFPYPLEKGDKLRLYHGLKGLADKNEVHLISITERKISEGEILNELPFLSSARCFYIEKWRRISKGLWSILSGNLPIQTDWIYSQKIYLSIKQQIENIKPDITWFHLFKTGSYKDIFTGPTCIDLMDSFSTSMNNRSEIANLPWSYIYRLESRRIKKYEKNLINHFTSSYVISNSDAIEIDANLPVIPNGVDSTYYHPILRSPEYDLGFIGNLSYLPNIEAVKLLNIISNKNAIKYKVIIAGASPSKDLLKLNKEKFYVSGWVADNRKFYSNCKIFVAPIWKGTGQQNKILEAMSMGIPCVTTPKVNESIGAISGKEIILADSIDEFISAINNLEKDENLRKEIAIKARQFVVDNFTWDQHVYKLEKVLKETIKKYDKK